MSAKSARNRRRDRGLDRGSGRGSSTRSCQWQAARQRNVRTARCRVPSGTSTRPSRSSIRVGQGDRELVVLVADRRARGRAAGWPSSSRTRHERYRVPSWYSPSSPRPPGLMLPEVVEDRERVAVLEHPGAVVGRAGGGQHVVRVALRMVGPTPPPRARSCSSAPRVPPDCRHGARSGRAWSSDRTIGPDGPNRPRPGRRPRDRRRGACGRPSR